MTESRPGGPGSPAEETVWVAARSGGAYTDLQPGGRAEALAAAASLAAAGAAVGVAAGTADDAVEALADGLAVAAGAGEVLVAPVGPGACWPEVDGRSVALAGVGRLADLGPPRPIGRLRPTSMLGGAPTPDDSGTEGGDSAEEVVAASPPGLGPAVALPTALPTVVGRRPEIRALAPLVETGGLVTVTGPGGVGKTTVGLRVAARVAARFASVSVVDLAPLRRPEDVVEAIAGAGPADGNGPGGHLLVVDCCEHVIEHVRGPVAERLAAGDTVLATSRVPLGVPGETLFPLDGLEPEAATRLFADRSQRVRPGAAEVDDPAVLDLCRRLDHLPLAIELAAARSRVLTPAAMADRLTDRFATLGRNPGAAQEHHRTLDAAIAWSYDMLDPTAAHVLRRVAVLAAPFDLGAAEAVSGKSADGAATAGGSTLDVVDALVSRSLLVADPGSVTPFRLLESIRAFAATRLALDPAERDAAAAGVLTWLCDATAPLDETDAAGRDGVAGRLEASAVDVVDAFELALQADPPAAVTLGGRLGAWFLAGGRIAPGLRLCRAAMNVDPGGDPLATARLLNATANLEVEAGHSEAALPLYERSVAARRGSGGLVLASALNDLAVCLLRLGDLGEARRALAEAADLSSAAGDRWTSATTLVNVGGIAVAEGDLAAAAESFGSAAAEMRALGDERTAAAAEANLGMVLLDMGRPEEAADHLARAAGALAAHHDRHYLPAALGGAAGAALALGDAERAARLWGGARALASASGADPGDSDGTAAAVRVALAPGRYEDLTEEGGALPVEVLVALTARPSPTRSSPDEASSTTPAAAAGDKPSTTTGVAVATGSIGDPGGLDPADEGGGNGRPDGGSGATMVCEGEIWTLTFRGRTSRLRQSRGAGYLARILAAAPGEVHVLDLAGSTAHGRAGPAVDETARNAYRHRIEQLQDDVARFEARGDDARAAAADDELARLVAELGAAFGLGGRPRRPGDDVERARKAVGNRLRDTLAKLAVADPSLARHLEVSMRTGTFCRYEPESPRSWTVVGP